MLNQSTGGLRALLGILVLFSFSLQPLITLGQNNGAVDCEITCPADLSLDCYDSTDPEITGYPSITCTVDCGGCTLTYGYWKTHSEYGPAPYDETWTNLEDGADTDFFGTGESYHSILWTPPSGGNAYLILAHQWIAVQMNLFAGASIPADVLESYDLGAELLELYQDDIHIPNGSSDRTLAIELAGHLDEYNNGIIGPGHCGDNDDQADCDETIEDAEWYYSDEISGECPIIVTRTWTAQVGDQMFTCVQILSLFDNEAPALMGVPADLSAECGDDIPEAPEVEATDDCDPDVLVIMTESVEDLDCGYILTRTWTATDDCGNEVSATQHITVTDTLPPFVFEPVADEISIECDEEDNSPSPVFLDWCDDDVTVELSIIVVEDNGCELELLKTWTATDNCGNQATVNQTVHVVDTTAPELSEYPENLVLDCGADLPEPPQITANDNCDESVSVSFEESIGDGVEDGCQLTQPISSFYNPDWAVWLQGLPVAYQYYSVIDGQFIELEDGTAHIIATVVSTSNSNGGWLVDVWFGEGMDWDTWQSQEWPNSYKDDFNVAGDNYLDWIYYIINNNAASMTGWGDFEGSYLELQHAPSSNYYGYQLGIAANNVNLGYGSGGWFTYQGWILDSSNGTEIYGDAFGDMAFMHECCDTPSVTWTWTAEDCAGNVTSHSATISFVGGEGLIPEPNIVDQAFICVGDLNHNHIVETQDLLIMLSEYGCQSGCAFDVNNDGKTNTADLLALLSNLGQTCN